MILAERMHRLGTESAFEVLARAHKLALQGRDIINLGIGQPDFPTPENIVAAAQKALADGHHGYTPANGILPLREAVAEDILKYRGVEIDPDRIVIVPGGKVTMYFAITMFGEPGVEIMYPDPGFPIYRSVIEFSGAKAVPIPLYEESGFSFSAEEVLAQITDRTRLIIVNSPANPTGGVVPKEELDKLVAGLERHPQVMVMSDEIYARMVYDNVPHASMTVYPELEDRLILLDGWSKTYAMTGWRLGYAVWPRELAEHATRLAINIHSCVNAATQYAGIEALKGPQDAVDRMVAAFDQRRQVIVERLNALPGFRCVRPGGAFYAFPNIGGTGYPARRLQDELLNEVGVALVAGTSFGDQGEGYIRFSYANSVENIERAIDRIGKFLGQVAGVDTRPIGPVVERLHEARPPERQTMPGARVRLEPIDHELHAESLYALSHGADMAWLWDYMSYGPFADLADFTGWLEGCAASADPLYFAVVDLASGQASGMTALMNIAAADGRIEAGQIWYAPSIQRTPLPTEAMFLMFSHVFDELGYRRLEWKCNDLNEPSKQAARRLGFTYEGTFRQHMIVKGRNRDTAWFSILDSEWPAVRANMERWLAPENFDEQGRQRVSLTTLNAALRES